MIDNKMILTFLLTLVFVSGGAWAFDNKKVPVDKNQFSFGSHSPVFLLFL